MLNDLARDLRSSIGSGEEQTIDDLDIGALVNQVLDVSQRSSERRSEETHLHELDAEAAFLYDQFERSGVIADINRAIDSWRSAASLTLDSDVSRPGRLSNLGRAYLARFKHRNELQDLERSLEYGFEAVSLTLKGHPHRPAYLINLVCSYIARFDRLGELSDLNVAIELGDEAASLTCHDHPLRSRRVTSLGNAYLRRFESVGQLKDLEKAIEYGAEASSLTANDHPDRSKHLSNLGNAYLARFHRLGEVPDLSKGIACRVEAVSFTPGDHVDRPDMLSSLGSSYLIRFKHLGKPPDLNKAVECGVEAVLLAPKDHPNRPRYLSSLGSSYISRFEALGELPDLNHGVECGTEAVLLTPSGHTARPGRLHDLGVTYRTRFGRLDQLSDLNRAIEYGAEAVSLAPDDNVFKPIVLSNVGSSYLARFQRLGELLDLNKAIECGANAAALTPRGYIDKPGMLNSLGGSYMIRFNLLGELPDLNKAIEHILEAVSLVPDGHVNQPGILSSLGTSYLARFHRLGEESDLNKAIEWGATAVALAPNGHINQAGMLNSLGRSYMLRFRRLGELPDLNNGIKFTTEAVSLAQKGHPERPEYIGNLGSSYESRFKSLGELPDLNKAIECGEEAVSQIPDGHPDRPRLLIMLGDSYETRFSHLRAQSDHESVISCYMAAARDFAGVPHTRLNACRKWAQSALHHPRSSPYRAYQQAMELLPQLIWIGTTLEQRYSLIAELGDFATEAASYAISSNNLELALEWLETGRSIVWGQIAQLRTPFELLADCDSKLASELREVGRMLERAGSRSSSVDPNEANERDLVKEASKHIELALHWTKLLSKARSISGFEDFLCPPKSNRLLPAAQIHPIVVINAHRSRCDALIIQPNNSVLLHVPLPDFSVQAAMTAQKHLVSFVRYRKPGHLSKLGSLEGSMNNLWSGIVQPVLNYLGYTRKLPVGQLPHITWCTTGILSFLPLHAAQCYDQSCSSAFDFVISSYTPTLSVLLTIGERAPSANSGILAVGQEHTPGCDSLPGTVDELVVIGKHAQTIPYLQLNNSEATIDKVLDAMEHSSWVHLACHGSQDITDPTQSAFHLHDGSLTLATISKRSFRDKGLAFLSACQTAAGDENLPDEAVHLAAGMLMAGYSSVIGTMWSIADEDGPRVADKVYGSLLKDGKMDHTKAARALHEAVAKLRATENVSFERWAPFIHIGH